MVEDDKLKSGDDGSEGNNALKTGKAPTNEATPDVSAKSAEFAQKLKGFQEEFQRFAKLAQYFTLTNEEIATANKFIETTRNLFSKAIELAGKLKITKVLEFPLPERAREVKTRTDELLATFEKAIKAKSEKILFRKPEEVVALQQEFEDLITLLAQWNSCEPEAKALNEQIWKREDEYIKDRKASWEKVGAIYKELIARANTGISHNAIEVIHMVQNFTWANIEGASPRRWGGGYYERLDKPLPLHQPPEKVEAA